MATSPHSLFVPNKVIMKYDLLHKLLYKILHNKEADITVTSLTIPNTLPTIPYKYLTQEEVEKLDQLYTHLMED